MTGKVFFKYVPLVVGTFPPFIVNERPIQGALPLAEFRKVIDAALLVSQLKK